MAFEDLYQEIILDHYRNPANYGEMEEGCHSSEHENPVCGDRLQLLVQADKEGIIQKVKFHGSGCAISMASASMMTELIKGQPLDKVKAIVQDFIEIMRGEKEPEVLEKYGDLAALQGVIQFPVRIKCATLAWHALQEVMKKGLGEQN